MFSVFRGAITTLLLSLATFGVAEIRAATVLLQADLEQLVAESESAALAEVVEVRHGRDERGLHSTWVTIRIDDPIFGNRLPTAGETYTFKSYGAPVRMPDGSRVFIDGTPDYRAGQDLLLMLLPVSRWGFSGTAGLSQGVFRVAGGPDARTAESLAGNRNVLGEDGLSRWLDPGAIEETTEPAAEVPYPLLRRALVGLAKAAEKETR